MKTVCVMKHGANKKCAVRLFNIQTVP